MPSTRPWRFRSSGTRPMPSAMAWDALAVDDRLAAHPDVAGRAPIQPEERGRDFRTPGADETGKTEHFARAQRERHVGEPGGAREARDAEELRSGLGAHVRRKVLLDAAADHHLDETGLIDLGGRHASPRGVHHEAP